MLVNCLNCVFCDLLDEYDLSFGISGGLNSRILFGSPVSNKSIRFSDYDILILLYKYYGRNDENRFLDIVYDIDFKYNILVDADLRLTSGLESRLGRQLLLVAVLKNGIYT